MEPCVSCFYLTYTVWNMCERVGTAVVLTITSLYNLVCRSVQYLLKSAVEYRVYYNITLPVGTKLMIS